MTEVLSFPGLGWEITLNRVAFSIGSKPIYWYGILFAMAFLVAVSYALWRAPKLGIYPDRALDVVMGAFVAGIICARLYYVMFSWELYRDNPISALYIWEGGIGIYGGLIGAFAAGIFLCRWRKVRLLPMLDIGGAALLVAQAIGRWGNFVNMEAFGGNTTLPWGMTSPTIQRYLALHAQQLGELGMKIDPMVPVHPTFFYESAWNLLGFFIIGFWLLPRRKYDGQMFISYLTWYGAGRFIVEGLRTDSLMWGSLRVSQGVAFVCMLLGLLVLARNHTRLKNAKTESMAVLFSQTEEGRLTGTGEFYKLSPEEQIEVRQRDVEQFYPNLVLEKGAEAAAAQVEPDQPEETGADTQAGATAEAEETKEFSGEAAESLTEQVLSPDEEEQQDGGTTH